MDPLALSLLSVQSNRSHAEQGSSEMVSVMLRPGPLGLEHKAGMVTRVLAGTQASGAGVQRGWRICYVNGNRFAADAFDKCIEGKQPFLVIFEMPFEASVEPHDVQAIRDMTLLEGASSPVGSNLGGMQMSIKDGQLVLQMVGPSGGMAEVSIKGDDRGGISFQTRTAELDAGGAYSTDTRVLSMGRDKDGELTTTQYQETSVGNQSTGVRETKQASATSSNGNGVVKKSLQRQIGSRGKSVVKEVSANSARTAEMIVGMTPEQTEIFDREWRSKAVPNLSVHGDWSKFEGLQQESLRAGSEEAVSLKNARREQDMDPRQAGLGMMEDKKWDWIRQQLQEEDEQRKAEEVPCTQKPILDQKVTVDQKLNRSDTKVKGAPSIKTVASKPKPKCAPKRVVAKGASGSISRHKIAPAEAETVSTTAVDADSIDAIAAEVGEAANAKGQGVEQICSALPKLETSPNLQSRPAESLPQVPPDGLVKRETLDFSVEGDPESCIEEGLPNGLELDVSRDAVEVWQFIPPSSSHSKSDRIGRQGNASPSSDICATTPVASWQPRASTGCWEPCFWNWWCEASPRQVSADAEFPAQLVDSML